MFIAWQSIGSEGFLKVWIQNSKITVYHPLTAPNRTHHIRGFSDAFWDFQGNTLQQ